MRVSLTVGSEGPILTPVMDGAAFSMVMDALSGVPESVPSFGVTWQVMTSPLAKPEDSVVPVPKTVLPLFHV